MSSFVPKHVSTEAWKRLTSYRATAVRFHDDEVVFLRLGTGQSLFLSLVRNASNACEVNIVGFENGTNEKIGSVELNGFVSLGRTDDCDIKVLQAIVSRQHFQLWYKDKILVIKDMGSTNGTYVHEDHYSFDIEAYIEKQGSKDAGSGTLDPIHEAFGQGLDEFLAAYSENKGKDKNGNT